MLIDSSQAKNLIEANQVILRDGHAGIERARELVGMMAAFALYVAHVDRTISVTELFSSECPDSQRRVLDAMHRAGLIKDRTQAA